MSNAPAATKTAPPDKATPSDLGKGNDAQSAPPEIDLDSYPSIRVGMMTFVTKALPVSGVNSVHDHITARKDPNVNGVDVWYIPAIATFKVVRNNREIPSGKPLLFHASRVEFWEPM